MRYTERDMRLMAQLIGYGFMSFLVLFTGAGLSYVFYLYLKIELMWYLTLILLILGVIALFIASVGCPCD